MGAKIILILSCLGCIGISSRTIAQNIAEGERKFMIKSTGSLYKANMLQSKTQHYYVGGNLELFFHDKYSFRGDIYSLIGEKNEGNYSMKGTTQLSAGFNRHFPMKRLSPFVGLYTGMTRLHSNSYLPTFAPDLSHPTIQNITHVGLNAGVQYYFYKYFHFFAEARYTHQLSPYDNDLLDEISYSAGLGFQIPTKK